LKKINILSVVQAHSSLKKECFSDFLNLHGIQIKDQEIEDLTSLVDILNSESGNKNIFNGFYVGYQIPQISKEFDLLRFGTDCILNIELKSSSTKEKILRQLKRNKYYLSFIGKSIHNFSFVSETKELYVLDEENELAEASFQDLEQIMSVQLLEDIKNVDELFNPSSYLVSPFNSTDKFVAKEYFLTNQQEDVKTNILSLLNNSTTPIFISITGNAGTGKTLLTYDIANELEQSKKSILLVHCGYLNDGQNELIDIGWKIISIRNLRAYDLSDYDVVIIDEAQRIKPDQFTKIVDEISSINGNCLFSYDKSQTLAAWEAKRDIDGKINDINSINTYHLTAKIRTNKEIAAFIKTLFNNNRKLQLSNSESIELNYFISPEDAREFLKSLNEDEWETLRLTPSQYDKEHHELYSDPSKKNSHEVIGQEFDNVAVVIDEFFFYNKKGELSYRSGAYYHPVKMLFQNITRTRKKLNLIIINNEEILERCISVLNI